MTTREKILRVRQELDEQRRKVKWLLKEQEKSLEDTGLYDKLRSRGLPVFQVEQDKHEACRMEKTMLALDDAVSLMERAFARLSDAASSL